METMASPVDNEREIEEWGTPSSWSSWPSPASRPVRVEAPPPRTAAPPRSAPVAPDAPPPLPKPFIVARGHTTVYQHLRRSVGHEVGVKIIYDRRPAPPKAGRLRRLATRVRGALGPSRPQQVLEALGRRQRTRIDQDLKTKGWAVVRLDVPRP